MSEKDYEDEIDRLKAALLEASYREHALQGQLDIMKQAHHELSEAYSQSEHRCDQCNKEAQQIMADLHYLQRMYYEGQF